MTVNLLHNHLNRRADMSIDSVLLTDSGIVRDGLADMLTAAIGDHAYDLRHVEVSLALLVIEAAKRADDRKDWFPRGKWATVQAMQNRTERELSKMFKGEPGALLRALPTGDIK